MSIQRLTKEQNMAVLNWFWEAESLTFVQQKF